MNSSLTILFFCFIGIAALQNKFNRIANSRFKTQLNTVPLELLGQLDASKSWPVKIIFEGKVVETMAPESVSLLEIGEKVFREVPSSCRNGSLKDLFASFFKIILHFCRCLHNLLSENFRRTRKY